MLIDDDVDNFDDGRWGWYDNDADDDGDRWWLW